MPLKIPSEAGVSTTCLDCAMPSLLRAATPWCPWLVISLASVRNPRDTQNVAFLHLRSVLHFLNRILLSLFFLIVTLREASRVSTTLWSSRCSCSYLNPCGCQRSGLRVGLDAPLPDGRGCHLCSEATGLTHPTSTLEAGVQTTRLQAASAVGCCGLRWIGRGFVKFNRNVCLLFHKWIRKRQFRGLDTI